MQRADTHAAKGEYARAINDYDQAIRLNPTLTEAIDTRAAVIAGARVLPRVQPQPADF